MAKGLNHQPSGDPFGRKNIFTGTGGQQPQVPRVPMVGERDSVAGELARLIGALTSSHKVDTERWNYWTEQLLQETKLLNRTFGELVQQNNLLLDCYIKDVRIAELKAVHWEACARNAWMMLEALGQTPPDADSDT